jgi:hypothetical protein
MCICNEYVRENYSQTPSNCGWCNKSPKFRLHVTCLLSVRNAQKNYKSFEHTYSNSIMQILSFHNLRLIFTRNFCGNIGNVSAVFVVLSVKMSFVGARARKYRLTSLTC